MFLVMVTVAKFIKVGGADFIFSKATYILDHVIEAVLLKDFLWEISLFSTYFIRYLMSDCPRFTHVMSHLDFSPIGPERYEVFRSCLLANYIDEYYIINEI